MKRVIVFIVLAMVVIGSCAAQSANNDAQRLVGTWVSDDNVTYVFNANGTGTRNGNDFFWGFSIDGSLFITAHNTNYVLYMSPDGRRIIFNKTVFQKR